MERLNGFIRRLPRFAELTIQCSKLIQSSTPPEMILELLMMMSAHHQSIQVIESSYIFVAFRIMIIFLSL